ncbi:MAG: LEPR-XLL domain-containing protein, partial [Sulfitobacter sp.]|nr:LEPR-XLL domain-containing protein [Sulfitobacter sp.]
MSVWSLFKRIVRKEGARANSSRFRSHGVLRDPSNDSLNREESFRVEALEPRILLSADPVLGEMARIADKAGWDDPLANTAAIVDIIDDVAGQDSKVAEIETLEPIDPEVVWPEAWSEGVASADPDTPHLDHLTLAVDATGAAAINLADAQATIDEAMALWEAAVGTPVTGLTFSVGQLSGRELASYSAGQITIDDNAAGAGWFIDATLSDNAEYTTLDGYTLRAGAGDAATSVDLLTAVLHELGHAYGFDHGDGLALMGAELDLGERLLLPTIVPADPASLPALSSQLYYQVLADGAIT